ncbi:MAG TPA: nucleotidyltransferase domain-containing protein [archaeon]|nr:nucleotidyltransferase domain-containing protein [archaeon]
MDRKVTKGQELEMRVMKIYISDYAAKIHVREISRMVKASHRTISLILSKFESRGIMKHEDVGRSKQYSLNFENATTKDCIKAAESFWKIRFLEKHFTMKKLIGEISNDLKNTPLILFGSYAKGSETKESDIDILVVKTGEEKIAVKKLSEFAETYKIDIQLQKASAENFEAGVKERDNLVVEIMKSHIILNNADFFVDIFWRNFNG